MATRRLAKNEIRVFKTEEIEVEIVYRIKMDEILEQIKEQIASYNDFDNVREDNEFAVYDVLEEVK